MNIKRYISAVLALLMLIGVFTAFSTVSIFAADEKKGASNDEEAVEEEEEEKARDYLTYVYYSPQEKLDSMKLMLEKFGWQLYIEEYTGEVAWRNATTGQVHFTNPYDVAAGKGTSDTKTKLLSQIIIKFTDNNKETTYTSYVEAAQREQIKIKNIKNGIRVEYTIGREETRKLVPRWIEKTRFEELILSKIDDESVLRKFDAYYSFKDPTDLSLSDRAVKEMQSAFPCTSSMAIYVFDPYAEDREFNLIESYINQYAPDYTYETLEEDHDITGYEGSDKAPPLFKLSLEYYLDEKGLSVRLPANGIRFDEASYQLTYISVLPYFGAGSSDFTGYTFIPDGSGALVRFEDVESQTTIAGKLYGVDYAYHEISASNQKVMRMPVYGVVENGVSVEVTEERVWINGYNDAYGEFVPGHYEIEKIVTPTPEDKGFLAIIEEGDALANIISEHGGVLHNYNSVYTTFYPRPRDTYNLAESISVGANAEWTVVSSRKYTGSYRIRFVMLTDEALAEANAIEDYYEVSWLGMASAYRDYLENKGTITRKEKTDENIPLYIESFGALDTASSFLSFPTTVRTALTTFDNVKTMYDDLAAEGITNINFRLTGFANGGMHSSVPNGVDFEKSVGGNKGYEELLDYAEEKDFGVFPDFDFSYATSDGAFDGFSYKKDATRTIDNRYSQKRLYYSSYQETLTTGQTCISPSVFSKFYGKVSEDLTKMGTTGISVSTLGSDLNSDFDEDEPYNREDSKELVTNLLATMSEDYAEIMLDAGNAYTWQYADHILNVNLDSSHYNYASHSVPFIGMVLHGYVNFSGAPTNMASDTKYETLKMIENGALPYFTLSYDNTALLKEDNALSKYYSVAYQIWKDDLVDTYNNLNDLLSGVQDATIVNHEFLDGERIPDEDEIQADADAKAEAEAEAKEIADKAAERLERARKLAARKGGQVIVEEEEPDSTLEDLEEFLGDDEPKDTEDEKSEGEKAEGENAEGEEEIEAVEGVTSKKEDQANVSKYAVESGSIVRVTYSNGVSYIINYNRFAVTVEGYEIEGLGFVEINA